MKAKGWEVTATDYHFDQEIYSWRHQLSGGKSPTLLRQAGGRLRPNQETLTKSSRTRKQLTAHFKPVPRDWTL